jgi:hypothetical protein
VCFQVEQNRYVETPNFHLVLLAQNPKRVTRETIHTKRSLEHLQWFHGVTVFGLAAADVFFVDPEAISRHNIDSQDP